MCSHAHKLLIVHLCSVQVDLSQNYMGPEGGKAVADALRVSGSLTYLRYNAKKTKNPPKICCVPQRSQCGALALCAVLGCGDVCARAEGG